MFILFTAIIPTPDTQSRSAINDEGIIGEKVDFEVYYLYFDSSVRSIMTHKPYMDLFQTLMTRVALGQIGFGVSISGISSFSKCVLI